MSAYEGQMSGRTASRRALSRALFLALVCSTMLTAESRLVRT